MIVLQCHEFCAVAVQTSGSRCSAPSKQPTTHAQPVALSGLPLNSARADSAVICERRSRITCQTPRILSDPIGASFPWTLPACDAVDLWWLGYATVILLLLRSVCSYTGPDERRE
jgi:hypothetical protein